MTLPRCAREGCKRVVVRGRYCCGECMAGMNCHSFSCTLRLDPNDQLYWEQKLAREKERDRDAMRYH